VADGEYVNQSSATVEQPENRGHSSDFPIRRWAQRLTVGQFFAFVCAGLMLLAVVGIVAGELALSNLSQTRSLAIYEIDPASASALDLANALVNEETGVRGYVITGHAQFLDPYNQGRAHEQAAYATLQRLTRQHSLAEARGDVALVRDRAEAWRMQYALATIARRRTGPTNAIAVQTDAGKALFDALRNSLSRLDQALSSASVHARANLSHAATTVEVVFAVFAALLLASAALLTITLRRGVSEPIALLGRQARTVARGQFSATIDGQGPRDVAELATDMDTMRQRIVRELEALRLANEHLDIQSRELTRSNTELEQFAYVASHDLQEPIRKVASFTQLLQRRYGGQLDERADEYIAFAVDGAKRMQVLINDLLAFSRVGRIADEQSVVNLGESLSQALAGLSTLIEETGATINAGELPSVRGEPALLSLVFQNLVGNALKFRGAQRPLVSIRAQRQGDDWLVSCSDNGIGIDPQYAERIFVIFQRLHPKEHYEGTGIGLAMCRKIIEYHHGRIWLDQETSQGTTLHFTLPAAQEKT
jgi:signal transduction histidine kinase